VRSKAHGRIEDREVQLSTRVVPHLDWPGLAQVCHRVRTTVRQGKSTVEVDYAITSLSRSRASAAWAMGCWRDHWGIENRSHYVRDVTFGEDASRIRKGGAPQILAACRNAAISLLRRWGCQNIAAALRQHAYQPRQLFAKLGLLKK
jgi:predicted transposase YbfD/YdcC